MNRQSKNRKGSTLLEFALVGIPIIFVLISTVEIGRGMWSYQTLAYAVKSATKYASVHGNGCRTMGNTCGITVGSIARDIKNKGVGLVPADLTLTLTDDSGSVSCPTLTSCLTSTTAWPTVAGGATGSNITITGRYSFRSGMAMFWPGHRAVQISAVQFPATARATVQY
jgi:Flp pilus assembly protein TadG